MGLLESIGLENPIQAGSLKGGFHIDWTFIAIILLIVIIGAIVIYAIYQQRIYKYRIIVFENLTGQGFQPTIKDKARRVKMGDGGEEVLYLKKLKAYRSAYGRKMGKNTYWFAIGADGYWYNITFGDLDTKMGMLDIEVVDRDMRLFHVAVRKNIQERYRKQKFMEKYGAVVISGIFLLIALIGILLMLRQMNQGFEHLAKAMELTQQVMEQNTQVLGMVDTIKSGGSGLTPA
jgi:uncharacterized integral membrane protein